MNVSPLIKCPDCDNSISPNAESCKFCGAPVNYTNEKIVQFINEKNSLCKKQIFYWYKGNRIWGYTLKDTSGWTFLTFTFLILANIVLLLIIYPPIFETYFWAISRFERFFGEPFILAFLKAIQTILDNKFRSFVIVMFFLYFVVGFCIKKARDKKGDTFNIDLSKNKWESTNDELFKDIRDLCLID
jgi:hypothetical protein